MEKQRWLEELRKHLAAQGLPASYIERTVLEMSDHIDEIMEEKAIMKIGNVRDRVGLPADLAQTAAAEYRKRLFSRRHPILTFIVLPVPTLMFLSMAYYVWVVCQRLVIMPFAGQLTENASASVLALIYGVEVMDDVLEMAMFCLPAALFCRVARRSGQDWRWPLLACVILSCWVALRGSNPVGFGPSGTFGLVRGIVMVLPLIPFAISAWRSWGDSAGNRRLWPSAVSSQP
jgi:hypothetical protein